MGTPRASASVDQMRNVQRSTRAGGGSSEFGAKTKARRAAEISTGSGQATATKGTALTSWFALLTSDWEGADVRCDDVAQQVRFAHETGAQAWLSGAFAIMQGATGNRAVAMPNEAVMRSEDTTLPSTRSLYHMRSRTASRFDG
jgi:hypothetical protein